MRFVLFCHSLVSCWNHGNAHFLRGLVRALSHLGHDVRVFEPAGGWSRANMRAADPHAEEDFRLAFPDLSSEEYDPAGLDLDAALDGADVVLVHEWSEPSLAGRIGRLRARGGGFLLFFHDTHHRAVSRAEDMAAFDLSAFDGVLAFGEALREVHARRGWGKRAWTWHEAADTSLFQPRLEMARERDLVFVGNWGDGERSHELREFIFGPVRRQGLSATVHGVRYPKQGLAAVRRSGAEYMGWLANQRVPEVFARHRMTVHVPRRLYARRLPGIPTIRVFEALACGIPLLCSPWDDAEGLFRPGRDYLLASSGRDMERKMREVLRDEDLADSLRQSGLETIRARHTCGHRAAELLDICAGLGREGRAARAISATEAQA